MAVVNLQRLIDSVDDSERPMITALKDTLETEPDATLAAKLADDIKSICQTEDAKTASGADGDSKESIGGSLFYIWMLVIDIARCTPADHPWQDRLAEALEILRQTKNSAPEPGASDWSELPNLDLCMLDRWNINQDAESEEPLTEEEFEQWKNQNSFAARITSASYSPWLNFPVIQLREALEEPPVQDEKDKETRLWIACEWILRCGELVFDFLRSQKEMKGSLQPGSPCGSEVDLLGGGRWEFWKKRFQEVVDDAQNLNLDDSIVERILEAVRRMDAVSSKKDAALTTGNTVSSEEVADPSKEDKV